MIYRLVNRYCSRQTVLQVIFDLSLVSALYFGYCLVALEPSGQRAVPATHGFSLLAGLFLINTASGLYGPPRPRTANELWARAVLALVLGLLLCYAVFSVLPSQVADREKIRWLATVCIAVVLVHRIYSARGQAASRNFSRVLVLGSGTSAQLVGRTCAFANTRVEIVGYVRGSNESSSAVEGGQLLRGDFSLKERVVDLKVDRIIVALSERRDGNMPMQELLDCRSVGVQILDVSSYFEKMLGQIRIDQLHPGWLIFGNGFNHSACRDVAKRISDIGGSCLLLLMAAPLLILTALCITLESKGPVFYRQERVGQNGKTFWVLKFRSMRTDAEKSGTPQWAAAADERVTRVGGTIRRYRLDEFPQLLNVLKGEMSLVGPRPERPYFVDKLTRKIPFYALRHSVKPGVTGWAQVRYQYGASEADALEKLQYDLYYVKNHSLVLDIVILCRTIGVVMSGEGAR